MKQFFSLLCNCLRYEPEVLDVERVWWIMSEIDDLLSIKQQDELLWPSVWICTWNLLMILSLLILSEDQINLKVYLRLCLACLLLLHWLEDWLFKDVEGWRLIDLRYHIGISLVQDLPLLIIASRISCSTSRLSYWLAEKWIERRWWLGLVCLNSRDTGLLNEASCGWRLLLSLLLPLLEL